MSEVLVRHRVALVGAAIGGSLSPALHEREAAALGLDYTYRLLDLDRLPPGWTLRDADGLTGFNVTHPVKQAVIPQLDDLSPDARALGAVNTVTVEGGRLVGHNTDHSGFLDGLRHGLPDVPLGRIVVVGAGGAGSAVAYALANAGAAVTVVDPDASRVAALVSRLGVSGAAAVDVADADGVVNASPIGMTGHRGVPFDPDLLQARHWVADVVYRPLETALLTAARAKGCRVLDGGAMLVAQAARTLAVLTGATPDLDRMRGHLDVLAGRTTDA
ncbi:shikimate dehydrogenase [Amycolatopsis endophytica]|uniref:Shikimate dehydrogenase (NADP(+)) n=1 Tax=Amycolatopsis endophytica TaxID=860233 RepID=A0A853AW70_9PSEU|nr:shikimate dehydrogenase [Amycolatopsis endophytica]NYI86895.1 shikimate dehydrogenase [Amycolatopsis endophytica]